MIKLMIGLFILSFLFKVFSSPKGHNPYAASQKQTKRNNYDDY
jgi:hypothetical protein